MKRLALFQSPGEIVWGSHEQIHCEGPRNLEANPHRLIVLIPAWHHDEDIDIAVGVRRAVGVGAEQNDFVRLVSLGDFAGELANRAHGHVGATVIALGFVGEFCSRGHARILQHGSQRLKGAVVLPHTDYRLAAADASTASKIVVLAMSRIQFAKAS